MFDICCCDSTTDRRESPGLLTQVFVGHWCNLFLLNQDRNAPKRLNRHHFTMPIGTQMGPSAFAMFTMVVLGVEMTVTNG